MENYIKGLGKDLVDLRTELGMTQETMARYLGIGTSTLRLAEQEKTDLSPRLRNQVVSRLSELPQKFPEIISSEVRMKFWETSETHVVAVKSYNWFLDRLLGGVVKEVRVVEREQKRVHDSLGAATSGSDRLESILSKTEPESGDEENRLPMEVKIDRKLLEKLCDEIEEQSSTSSEVLERILTFYFGCKEFFLK